MNKDIKAGSDIHAGDSGYSEGTQEEYENFAKLRNQSLLKMRLREFEKASGLEIYGLGAKRVPWEAAMEKFAELIVQECAKVVEGGSFLHDQAPTAIFARECSGAIKRHFGINPNEITTAMLDTAIDQCEQELAKKKT